MDLRLTLNQVEAKTSAEAVAQLVRQLHLQNASGPLNSADEAGAFRESNLASLYGEALPIVLDANTLRGDVARACKQGHRTVLTSAANEGAFRIYCAAHIIGEFEEHGQRWSSEYSIDYAPYRQCWEEHYRPLVRLVDTSRLDVLLSPDEQQRISELTDRDDIPSVTLALAIQAVYLSEDRRAHYTVYNFTTTFEERKGWLQPLMAASDHAQLSLYVNVTLLVPVAGITGLFEIAKRLQCVLPSAPFMLFGAVAIAGFLFGRDKAAAIISGLKTVGQFYCDGMLMPAVEKREAHQRLIPQIPTWDELLETNSRTQVLTRAVMHRMARSRSDIPTAREVSVLLLCVPVDTSPARVGRVLHSGNFVATYRGCWQLGASLALENR